MLASDDEMMDAVVVKVGEERAREEDPLEKGTGDGQGEKGKVWEWLIFILCTQLDPRVKITLDGYSKSIHDMTNQPSPIVIIPSLFLPFISITYAR